MISPIQLRKLIGLGVLFLVAFAAVTHRLVELQVLWRERLRDLAHDNTRRVIQREPRRGDIRDVRGNLLGTSVFVKTVCADPVLIGTNQAEVARTLAPLLQTNETFLLEKLQPRIVRWDTNNRPVMDRYVVLKRKVRLDEWDKIEQAMGSLSFGINEKALRPRERAYFNNVRQKSIFGEDDQLRLYPGDSLGAHVVGFLGVTERDTSDGRIVETVGRDGIERVLDSRLRGVRGWWLTEIDKRRRELVNFREEDVEPQPGQHVILTLDAGLQHIVESELEEAWKEHSPLAISCIVSRPKTGEILALANLPTFNPNRPGESPIENLRNRVVTDFVEPGSTFKIVVVSAGLNDGLITLNKTYDCENGRFYYGGHSLTDHKPYGVLSVEDIIAKSSNIGAAKVGIDLGPDRLYRYIKLFGFGAHTGITLPGESGGLVRSLKKWDKLSITHVPMGHEIGVTHLQMHMAVAAIANQGKLMRPMLVDHLEDDSGRVTVKIPPQMVREVVSPAAAKLMVEALKKVVTTNGTAFQAALEDYVVAGKTGTAQKPGPKNVGYMPGKFISSFMGFFPADDPALCITVMMDEPRNGHYGGDVAAPSFHNIAVRAANYLNLVPTALAASAEQSRSNLPMLATGVPPAPKRPE